MCIFILSCSLYLYLFIQLGAELYSLTAGRFLFLWRLHVFLVFIEVSWVACAWISVHYLETLNCLKARA